jgi:hypothetical protein
VFDYQTKKNCERKNSLGRDLSSKSLKNNDSSYQGYIFERKFKIIKQAPYLWKTQEVPSKIIIVGTKKYNKYQERRK